MHYIIDEITNRLTEEEALATARRIFKNLKEQAEKSLPYAVIYGVNSRAFGKVFFEDPILIKSQEELNKQRDILLKTYPNSTILTLFREHLLDDAKPRYTKHKPVELDYSDLEVELQGKTHSATWNEWSGGEPEWSEDFETKVDYTFIPDEDEVEDALYDILDNDKHFDVPEEGLDKYIDDNFEDLVDEYEDKLKEYFKEDAISAAEDYYNEHQDEL